MARTPSTASGAEKDAGLELWWAAARWRRQVEAALSGVELTFTQWSILYATDSVVRRTREPTSQNAIATEAQLDKVTVSHVVRALEARGLLDRGKATAGRSWRVVVTSRGIKALASGTRRVRSASAAALARLDRSGASLIPVLRTVAGE